MTLSDAAGLALQVHGAVWVAAAAAYYKYGDRTNLFEKTLRGNQDLRRALRDNIATDLSKHLQTVVRDATHARSPVLDAAGSYIEHATDITESEPFYQAIRDYVSISAGSLLDYRLVLKTEPRWRTWAHRLSHAILALLILETLAIAAAVLVPVIAEPSRTVPLFAFLASFTPTCIVIVLLFCCLCIVHVTHGIIVDLREHYDSES